MEIDKLRSFVALAEEGGFSAAGKRLYKSHSSVSRALSSLENELGVPLAVRDKKSFFLTAAGQTLYEDAISILTLTDELPERVRSAEADGIEN